MSDLRIVMTSIDNPEMAQVMAKELVQQKLAACVQISEEGKSVYLWKGDVCMDEEYYLNIKTDKEHLDDVLDWLEDNHPYETPEIVILKANASDDYLDWVTNTLN